MGVEIGSRIGQYLIEEKLGEGGMAVVFRARDVVLERTVAIKVIKGKKQGGKELARFQREARALGQLNHPNIVRVLDYGDENGVPFLVMEYIQGGRTLRNILGKPISYQQAAALLLPVAKALAYAHEHRIVHRDIKPSNILIDVNGNLKLADFGIVKFLEIEETQDVTGTSVGIGTPEYMAPEQGLGKEVDERADIYAFGVLLYEVLTGKKPFQVDTPMEALLMKIEEEPIPPRVQLPGLPTELEQFLLKVIARKPEDRFQKMNELVEILEQVSQGNLIFGKLARKQIRKRYKVGITIAAMIPLLLILGWLLNYRLSLFQEPEVSRVSQESLTPSATQTQEQLPTSTLTPSPSATPSPTSSPEPSSTPTPLPTQTPTPIPLRPVINEENIHEIELLFSVNARPTRDTKVDLRTSPDGSTIAIIDQNGTRVWDTRDWSLLYSLEAEPDDYYTRYDESRHAFLYSPGGAFAASANNQGLYLLDTGNWTTPILLHKGDDSFIPGRIAFSTDEKLLALSYEIKDQDSFYDYFYGYRSTRRSSRLQIWDIVAREILYEISIASFGDNFFFTPNNQLFIVDNCILRVSDGSIAACLDEGIYFPSPDGNFLVSNRGMWSISGCITGTDFCAGNIWSVRLPNIYGSPNQVIFDTSNTWVSWMGRIWRITDGKLLYTCNERENSVWKMPGKNVTVSSNWDGIYFIDMDRMSITSRIPDISIDPICLDCAFSADGTLIPARFERLLRVFRVLDGRVVYTFNDIPSVQSLSFSPDGRLLILVNLPASDTIVSFWGIP